MDLSEANSPLLNEYKLEYLKRLLPQTFLGGLKICLPFKAPSYVYVLQLLVWSYPFLLGCIFTTILEVSDALENWLFAVILGIIIFLSHLLMHIVVVYFSKKKTESEVTVVNNNFLMEDDEILFTECLSMVTLDFVLSKKKHLINIVLHPILGGVSCGLILLFFQPSRTLLYFGNKSGAVLYFLIGWLFSCVSLYPLIGQQPKEPNIFRMNDKYELAAVTRICYVLVLTMIDRFNFSEEVHLAFRIIFMLLPAFWFFGSLPSIDVLFLWCGEQVLSHILGGSPMSSDIRFFISFSLSWLAVSICHFIPDHLTGVTLASMLAILLSTDFPSMILKLVKSLRVGSFKIYLQVANVSRENQRYRTLKNCTLLSFFVLVTGLIVGLTEFFKDEVDYNMSVNTLSYLLVVLVTLSKSTCWCQQIFIGFSSVKNPLFQTVHYWKEKYQTVIFILKFTLDSIVVPFVLVLLTSIFVHADDQQENDFIRTVLIFRNFRMIWQDTNRYQIDLFVFIIICWSGVNWKTWNELTFPEQQFVISMAIFWIQSCLCKVWFIVMLIFSSKSVKGNQRKVNFAILLTIVAIPILLPIIVSSVLLSSPLLPLFTLPVFIIGFPRPLRMWPDTNIPGRSSSSDWVYYQQLTPVLQKALEKDLSCGALSKAKAGDYLLVRFQDRLVWISVLEKGLFYHNIIVKGLELQETSCHTAEAESIDEIFNFEHRILNKYFLYTLTPVAQLNLRVYSDAKSVLVGIIDNPDFLRSVSLIFPKILLYFSIKCFKQRCELGMDDVDSLQMDSNGSFGVQHHPQKSKTNNLNGVISDEPFSLSPFPISSQIESVTTVETNFTTNFSGDGRMKTAESNAVDEEDDEFGDFGFGDSDRESESSVDETELYSSQLSNQQTNFLRSKRKKIIDPPYSWINSAPYKEFDATIVSECFDEGFFCEVTKILCKKDSITEIQNDHMLKVDYKTLILNCFFLVEKADATNCSSITEKSRHCFRMFQGNMPWSPRMAWIENNRVLKDLVINAYRIAVKMSYDAFVLGLDDISTEEFVGLLQEFEEDWFIGLEHDDDWCHSVLREKPNLFSMGKCEKDGTYTSRLLSMQDLTVSIGTLNAECVRGIWSALALELFYMTNDDEERYSIQASPNILRNIVTQAADPPLGYPVFTSGLLKIEPC